MKNTYNTDAAKISISICTRQRPQMLATLLQSLENVIYPAGVEITIDVVENNPEKQLTTVIKEASIKIRAKVNHHWVPTLGIPIARNAALRIAKESCATHIIFIDDDERVAPSWLEKLWQTYLTFDERSVIQGAVISSIQTTKNEHLHDYFQRPIKSTGDSLDTCATNNVIVQIKALEDHDLTFDESHPLAGGTDNKLFRKAHSHGIPMWYCAEAIVYEDIPEERVKISWLTKRHFRIGLTMGQNEKKSGAQLNYALSQAGEVIRYCTKSLSSRITLNRMKADKRWLRACKAAGKSLGYFNITIDSYRKIDGN
jgi:succinoglycan biosynthesis protein ExoM